MDFASRIRRGASTGAAKNVMSSACVSSATGRIRRGEHVGERVLAIANFSSVFELSLPFVL